MRRRAIAALRAAICLLAADLCLAQTAAPALREPTRIPAQELAGALRMLAHERGLQIVYRSNVVGHLRTRGANGDLTLDQALATLLGGTGLSYHYLDQRTITITPLASVPPGQHAGPPRPPGGNAHDEASSGAGASGLSGLARTTSAGSRLEEVMITAEKMPELASRTPLALSVYSGETLRRAGVDSIADLRNIDPEVSVGQSNAGVNIGIRGVSTTDVTSKGEQDVVFDVDGIPMGRPREMMQSFFDIDRVEVLRGPQGTLYGLSSTAGAINVITNKPKDYFDAAGSLDFGDYGARRGEAMLNLPVTAGLALRLAADFDIRDGYLYPIIDNPRTAGSSAGSLQDEDDRTLRLTARWNVSRAASLLLTGTFGRYGGIGDLYYANYPRAEALSGAAARTVYYNPFGGSMDDDFRELNAELDADFGPVWLTYDGARLDYRARERTTANDNPDANLSQTDIPQYGRNPAPVSQYNYSDYSGDYITNSQELRLSSARPQTFEWLVGGSYFHENLFENDHSWNAWIADLSLAASTNSRGILGTTTHTSWGVFAQVNWHLTGGLRLTLGLRESDDGDTRRATFALNALNPGGTPWLDAQGNYCEPPVPCVGLADYGNESGRQLTYRVGVDYRLSRSGMLYAYVATGYKAAGFNDFEPALGFRPGPYPSELLTAYELGYKGRLRSNLSTDSDFYYYDYSRDQINSPVFLGGFGVLYTRATPTTLYGWESRIVYRGSKANEIEASLALEKGYYDRFMAGVLQNVDWSGRSLDNIPAAAVTLAYEHRWFFADGSYIEARPSAKCSSGYLESDFANAIQYRQKAYTRSDFALTYASASGKLSLEAYVHNIENGLQITAAPAPPQVIVPVPDGLTVPITEPRMYGLRLSIRY